MAPTEIIFLISIGLFAGIGSGLFGIGGGVIIVPLLIFLQGFQQKTATATSLIAMVLPVGILGIWSYYRAGIINHSHFKLGFTISLGLFIGAFLGSKLAILLPPKYITRGFAILLIYVSVRLWIQSTK